MQTDSPVVRAPGAPVTAAPAAPSPSRFRPSRSRVFRDVVQGVALITAALWGAYTFIYKEVVIPSKRAAALVVSPTLEAIGRRGDVILARATFHIVNHSDTKVYAPAIWYTIRGLKLQPVAVDDSVFARMNREAAEGHFSTSRYSQFTVVDVISVGKVNSEVEFWFDPGSEHRVEQILYIPADRYDAAQLSVQSLMTKSISELQEVRWRMDRNGDLEPRLVFTPESPYYAGGVPATLSDTTLRYVHWLRANQAGVNFVTSTLSLWRGSPAAAAPSAPEAAPAP